MRICWIHPTARTAALEDLWSAIETNIAAITEKDTTIHFRFPAMSTGFTRSLYAEHINSVLMLEEALKAQDEGFDGVFLGCWNDALWEAREILDIPVASVGEQSMLASLAMARKFAVITVSDKTRVAIERDIMAYGLLDRAINNPVRTIKPYSSAQLLMESVTAPEKQFIPSFEKVAKQCIDDGAEIILVGCTYYGTLLRKAGYRHIPGTQVPVMDSSAVAIKYLENMINIHQKLAMVKSRALTFAPPPAEQRDKSRNLFR
ncbi:aspartate/glutamate racemase family protein [Martelella alba]|uniref:Hydantoin racemase n=1 Tax=Martelella alba TaxID=2590451 RepID=A0ABY2SPD0_9HYPH|nr:aspartate/glutamate racemase family protein [Martelella alba]TKI06996.1 hydantoin racemase [Martelella alba]